MKLPRDWSGDELARRLRRLGYVAIRQSGSHVRLTTTTPTEHHITIPLHQSLRTGTLAAILDDVAAHLQITRAELLDRIS